VPVETGTAFRRGNQAIADAARQVGVHDVEVDFICECDDPYCLARVPLDLKTYERIRESGGVIALSGHDTTA
jgi:hypothetical protein